MAPGGECSTLEEYGEDSVGEGETKVRIRRPVSLSMPCLSLPFSRIVIFSLSLPLSLPLPLPPIPPLSLSSSLHSSSSHFTFLPTFHPISVSFIPFPFLTSKRTDHPRSKHTIEGLMILLLKRNIRRRGSAASRLFSQSCWLTRQTEATQRKLQRMRWRS